jgi:hypothetical protein
MCKASQNLVGTTADKKVSLIQCLEDEEADYRPKTELEQSPKLVFPFYYFFEMVILKSPVTIAERFNARTVIARSEPGIVSSNPTQGMNV